MSFNIGTKVYSQFCGGGVVISDIIQEEPGAPKRQMVNFENGLIGLRAYEIHKLDRIGEDDDGSQA
jgi:hypothetical protein